MLPGTQLLGSGAARVDVAVNNKEHVNKTLGFIIASFCL
jgi:hypothetical protein